MKATTKIQTCKTPDCNNEFVVIYRNGVKVSNYCKICRNKRLNQTKDKSTRNRAKGKKIPFVKGHNAKKNEKTKAMEKADLMFSRYIRLKYSFERSGERVCQCYTCGTTKPIKEIDNGHYISRENQSTRYDEDNCRPQCTTCNRGNYGESTLFKYNLEREIGPAAIIQLKARSRTSTNTSVHYFNQIADYFSMKIERLCNDRGIDNPWKY